MTDDEFPRCLRDLHPRAQGLDARGARPHGVAPPDANGPGRRSTRPCPGRHPDAERVVRRPAARKWRSAPDPRGLDGYHETVTVAFVAVIASRIVPGEDFAAFRDRNPDLFDRSFPALLRHYSPERLYSAAARQEFIEPDLEPLP